MDRRSMLQGSLALLATPAFAGSGSFDGVVLVAVAHGDPRFPEGADGVEALDLLESLRAEGRTRFVAGTGTLPDRGLAALQGLPPAQRRLAMRAGLRQGVPEDPARLLGALDVSARLVEGGHQEHTALRALAGVQASLAHSATPFFSLRRRALANLGDPDSYIRARQEMLAVLDAAKHALTRAMAARVAAVEPAEVLVVAALAARDVQAGILKRGISCRLLATSAARAVLDDGPLWWAQLRSGLPAATGSGLEPWGEAMRPVAVELARWPQREALIRAIAAQTGPEPLPLRAAHPVRLHVDQAAELLTVEQQDQLRQVELALRPRAAFAMSYDSFYDVLRVNPWIPELPASLTAALLVHELVHVKDTREVTAALGISPRDWALILNTSPLGVSEGLHCTSEDAAYAAEVRSLPVLGVDLKTAEGPRADRLKGFLSELSKHDPGSASWLSFIDSIVRSTRSQ